MPSQHQVPYEELHKKSPSILIGSLLKLTMIQNKGLYSISATLKPDTYGIKFVALKI
jgi:hypothetical protein